MRYVPLSEEERALIRACLEDMQIWIDDSMARILAESIISKIK